MNEPIDTPGCSVRQLPARLLVPSAEVAAEANPTNVPAHWRAEVAEPQRIALLTTKYWGPSARTLSVSFMESTSATLRRLILAHMNAWDCGVTFAATNGVGEVRISRAGSGYWSYLGTDVRLVPLNYPTMNLQGFSARTPDSEYRRVVRHETGHTLGFPHEHMRAEVVARIDRTKAYRYFAQTQGWPRDLVDSQVLTPLDGRSLYATPADQTSVMCYQLPGSITRDGRPILGGADINATDAAFAATIYPKPPVRRQAVAAQLAAVEVEWPADWPSHEDVSLA